MRILFDALGLPLYGGARSSALGWMRSVARVGRQHQFIALVSRREPFLDGMDNLEQVVVGSPGRLGVRLWAQRHIPALVREHRVDLVHFTKNHGCFLVPCPVVITINDLSRFYHPSMFSKVDVLYWRTVQALLLHRADRVIAISENTKRDLCSFYRLPAEQVLVIYPAPAARFARPHADGEVAATLEKYGIRRPYILSVGGLARHKNTFTALKAFYTLVDGGHLTEYTFVIVGGLIHTHNDERLLEFAARRADGHIRLVSGVDDDDIDNVYAGASLFVYPSLYEGFGLSPLEAMACGVPVLSSGAGALPEVLDDAAWMVENPYDVDAFAAGMSRVLTDAAVRERLVEAGRANVARFSWDDTARRTLDLYAELVA